MLIRNSHNDSEGRRPGAASFFPHRPTGAAPTPAALGGEICARGVICHPGSSQACSLSPLAFPSRGPCIFLMFSPHAVAALWPSVTEFRVELRHSVGVCPSGFRVLCELLSSSLKSGLSPLCFSLAKGHKSQRSLHSSNYRHPPACPCVLAHTRLQERGHPRPHPV